MKCFRWGVFGTGAISAKFIAGLRAARNSRVDFIASRTRASAERLASSFGIAVAIEGYAEAAARGQVDAIYIATPPSEHCTHALMCLRAGIPILVEKPFAATASEAQRVISEARAQKLFAMEAMWTRFLPAAQALRDRVQSGILGELRLVSGSFGMSVNPQAAANAFSSSLAGGVLAHLAPYPVSLGQWLFGPARLVHSLAKYSSTGIEEEVAFQLLYTGGPIGSFFASLRAWAPDEFTVMGTDGMLATRGSIVRPSGLSLSLQAPRSMESFVKMTWRDRARQSAFVHRLAQLTGRTSRKPGRCLAFHYSGNGYHYEADEVRLCIEKGYKESDIMPLNDSAEVAETLDAIRESLRATHHSAKAGARVL